MRATQGTTEGTTTVADTGWRDGTGASAGVRQRHAGGRRGVRRRQRRRRRRLRADLHAHGGVRQQQRRGSARRATTATPRTATSAAPTARRPRRCRTAATAWSRRPSSATTATMVAGRRLRARLHVHAGRCAATASKEARRGVRRRQPGRRRPRRLLPQQLHHVLPGQLPGPGQLRRVRRRARRDRQQGRQEQRAQGDRHLQRSASADSIVTTDFQFSQARSTRPAGRWRRARHLHLRPRHGPEHAAAAASTARARASAFLMLSTGDDRRRRTAEGVVIETPNSQVGTTDNGNPDDNALPARRSRPGTAATTGPAVRRSRTATTGCRAATATAPTRCRRSGR